MNLHHRHERIGERYAGRIVLLVGTILLGVLGAVTLLSATARTPLRTSILFIGSPMVLVSFDAAEKNAVVVTIPADAYIDGVYGVGPYSLDALWRLGRIDRRYTRILPESLEQAFGIGIPFYLRLPRMPQDMSAADASTVLKSLFSYRGILGFFGRSRGTTNMSIFSYLPYAVAAHAIPVDHITVLGAEASNVLTDERRPDGSHIAILDPGRLGSFVGTAFQDDRIRREALSVAVYNTTSMASLGSKIAATINRAGANVIAVDNRTPTIATCQLNGPQQALKSVTALFLRTLYRCRDHTEDLKRADLAVFLGQSVKQLFEPLP
ncbi:hypothetical protein M1555_04865 [Patescibacteria group bacterium]|nr:hypothetical protein [Patescibacteria group bacterium]